MSVVMESASFYDIHIQKLMATFTVFNQPVLHTCYGCGSTQGDYLVVRRGVLSDVSYADHACEACATNWCVGGVTLEQATGKDKEVGE